MARSCLGYLKQQDRSCLVMQTRLKAAEPYPAYRGSYWAWAGPWAGPWACLPAGTSERRVLLQLRPGAEHSSVRFLYKG